MIWYKQLKKKGEWYLYQETKMISRIKISYQELNRKAKWLKKAGINYSIKMKQSNAQEKEKKA